MSFQEFKKKFFLNLSYFNTFLSLIPKFHINLDFYFFRVIYQQFVFILNILNINIKL